MNTLVLNLTRFGDQLQGQAALNVLRHGGRDHVGLVCLENFAGAVELLRGLTAHFVLPRDGFLRCLERGWPGAVGELSRWKKEIFSAFNPERICNLTPSVAGRLLARHLADGLPLDGFGVDEYGFGTHASPWAAFVQAASAERGVSPFNLVDLFRKVAGAVPGEPADAVLAAPEAGLLEVMAGRLASMAPAGCRGYVALQLGASEERRRWPLEYFARLGDLLWREERLLPILVGSRAEAPLAGRYLAAAEEPAVSFMGETSLPELAALLRLCKLLVSNDTGTMHLAAGLSCPVLAIFLATAQPWDTGPYQEGSCSLEPGISCHPCAFGQSCPHELRCRKTIEPQVVGTLALSFLRTGAFAALSGRRAERPRVWLARQDRHGFMDLLSISGHGGEERGLWLAAQRDWLRQFLDRDRARPFALSRPETRLDLPGPMRAARAGELAELAAQLNLALEQGRMLLKAPVPQVRKRFSATLGRISAMWAANRAFTALGLLWRVEVEGESADLSAAMRGMEQYKSLLDGLLQELNSPF